MSNFDVSDHEDVNDVLRMYHQHIKAILGDKFIGMYLYGSLTTGHFDWHTSDIDFVVATTEEIRGDTLAQLQQMHIDLSTQSDRWGLEIEASYIPKDALWKHDIDNRHHPHIDRGSNTLQVEQHDMDWVVQRYALLENGVRVDGVPIAELIAPISVETLRHTMIELMDFWWVPLSHNPDMFAGEGNGYGRYAMLSMCRMFYTYLTGKTIAKVPAGQWALGEVDERWHPLIQNAISDSSGLNQHDVRGFIRYVADRLQSMESSSAT